MIYVPLLWVGARLAVMLPGAALQPGVSVFSGWTATRGASLTILGVVALSVVASLVLQVSGTLVFGGQMTVVAQLYFLVQHWIITMVGASILTTLYGHYVEGRPLV